MTVRTLLRAALLLAGLLLGSGAQGEERPRLVLTADDARLIRRDAERTPLLAAALREARTLVDAALTRPPDVPVPSDAGGPVHERHKRNYREMQIAGALFSITGDDRYALFVREMLLQYARLYPALPAHPLGGGEAVGRLFWQTLNEAVWLVHVAQAYDCVYDRLTPADRSAIEGALLRPMARFFTGDNRETHDRIHNHGTWTVAATGMLGFALRDEELVTMALRGTQKDGRGGFFRQLDLLFSPDGYYTEGPYYTRYALMPFFLFAQAIENNRPDLRVFEYRDGILRKAVSAALQQTDGEGRFLPLNDALKGMSFLAPELVAAVDIGYRYGAGDRGLLDIVARQGTVLLNGAGWKAASDLAAAGTPPAFVRTSIELRDGPDGTEGGVGILRAGPRPEDAMVVLKYTAHGKSHGHYDKLSILYHDGGREVLQDYGAVRFINVQPKNGGRYLPETASWARQTVAHNTVAVDGQSHFGGVMARSEERHADRRYVSVSDPRLQVMSASVEGAAPGVTMQRTVALVRDSAFAAPVVLDVFTVASAAPHRYDLPFHYLGHLVHTNVRTEAADTHRSALGRTAGYQHLWAEAEGRAAGPVSVTWLAGDRFYTLVSAADTATDVVFTRIGAGDPGFNLRSEPGVILRRRAASHVFASVLEPHGAFDPVTELVSGAAGRVTSIRVLAASPEGTVTEILGGGGLRWVFMTANTPSPDTARHTLTAGGTTYTWVGNYRLDTF